MNLSDPRLSALLKQLDQVLLVLERPVVQRQLFAFAAVVLFTWFLAEIIHRLSTRFALVKTLQSEDPETKLRDPLQRAILRVLLALEYTIFPLLGMLFSQLMVDFFARNGWPSGLMERWVPLFWLLLGYRVVVALFYAVMSHRNAHLYHRRLLIPLFVVVMVLVLDSSVVGTFSLSDIELLVILGAPITLGSLFGAVVVLYLFLVFSGLSQDILLRFLRLRGGADPGVTNTILTISRYTIIAIGILSSLSILGVDLSTLAIIGGGLSVGIGFGMQDLFANFFSGILLLFDQTLRPGDVIEIAGQRGTVDKMRIRSTVIRTPTNVEVYIPNKTLLTSAVAAHTNAVTPAPPSQVRETLSISVGYDSNLEQVREILFTAAHQHELVLSEPTPTVYLVRFGSVTIDFELGVWVDQPDLSRQVISDLGFAIWREFQAHSIQMQSPQPELQV